MPGRRPDRVTVAAVVLALAIFGGLAYLLVPGSRAAPQAGPAAAATRAGHRQAAPGRRQPAAPHSPAAPRSTAPGAGPGSAPPVMLRPVSAAAFGPAGTADGDNPQHASLAIDGRPRTAWQTDWYATSHFGNLKAGTGLLLDLGHRVTITGARILLGRMAGPGLQLRAGRAPAPARLRPVAHAAHARGMVRLRLARPASARYVLIWFTRLPPDPAGTYRAKVYGVRLR
jgi:hypothetical protein